MLTPYLPYPPSSGGQIRSFNLIKQLSRKHQITLCSLIKFDNEKKYVEKLRPFCEEIHVFKRPQKPFALSNILKTGFSLLPLLVIRNFSKSEKKALGKIVKEEKFDIIHAETFYVSPHIPKTNIPIVLVDQTIEFQVYQHFVDHFKLILLRPILYLDVLKIKFWEAFYWKKAAKVVAVSQRDAAVMRDVVEDLQVEIVPNGVGEDLMEDTKMHYNKTVLHMGNYAWLQNVESAQILAKKVFPRILEKIPDAKLIMAGQNTENISDLKGKNIELHSFSVDDIESVQRSYRESGILVSPIYGPGGTRLKILAAMATRLPVVTTKTGNEGIDAKDGKEILIGDTSNELAELAIKLFTDQELYKRIATNARRYVEENFTYEAIAEKLSSVYEEVAND